MGPAYRPIADRPDVWEKQDSWPSNSLSGSHISAAIHNTTTEGTNMTHPRWLVTGLATVLISASGWDALGELAGPTSVELTVVIGATCNVKLAGPVSVYVNNDYIGQAGGGSQVIA